MGLNARLVQNLRGLKNVPVPRGTGKTKQLARLVDLEPAKNPAPQRLPAAVQALFPEQVPLESLRDQPAAAAAGNADGAASRVWYSVSRTHNGNLPVYTDYNNAGGVWTEVRRIQGNVGALRNDLIVRLGKPKKDIWIQDTAKKILIKGNVSRQVKAVLAEAF